MTNISHDIIKEKGLIKSSVFAVFLILSSSFGVFVGFLWRDIFLSFFKKYDLYDNEEGFQKCGLKYGFLIALGFTFLASLFAVISVKISN